MEEENETRCDSSDEESEKSTPYTDICSGVKVIGSSESDGKGDMDNNNGDVGEVKSDDPFGIYNLLNHRDKNKEGESLVSDDPSKPPVFSKIVVEDNIVSRKEDGQANINVKGGGGSDKDSALPKGKCPGIASSLLEKMNEFVEIGQAMGFFMDGCLGPKAKKIDYFVLVEGIWKPMGSKLLMVGIYAPQDLCEKRMLWNYLHEVLSRWQGEAIVMGDFNEVRFPSERHDIPLGGFSFMWVVKDATKMSKLDRFLVSEGLLFNYPAMSGLILVRHLSYHRPIILRECDVNYGPIPFKMFHSWFDIEGFEQLVKDSWHNDVVVDLNEMSCLKKKFQMLKKKIKIWVQQNRVKANDKRKEIQEKLHNIDKQIDQEGGQEDLLNSRRDLWKDLRDLDALREKDLVQKAKVKWAIEGDENSKYFHGIINKKRHQMAIRGVSVNGEWVMDPPKVKQEFFQHFANRFSSCLSHRIRFLNDEVFPVSLNKHQHDMLEEEVTDVEIKKAVWDCGRNKSPGPDGFTFEFIRKFWEVIGGDVCRAVKCFFRSGSFPKGCNPSFIALIPKVNDAKFVKDFRPISLIGCQYKIVGKILANRLSSVIGSLVSKEQSAFIRGRQILDGPMILSEVIDWCNQKKRKAMIFKVDFEKAYDSVRWDFLDMILYRFGFGDTWRGWIKGCLVSSSASILVNGSPTQEFCFEQGLRQGDPLSPFLFLLVMESLHISFVRAMEGGFFKGIHVGSHESVLISHLFYADDAVFIGEWKEENLRHLV
ncbi:RNA-directed DNA polymerase, eukaryota, partial [Tanacetum coccineum]